MSSSCREGHGRGGHDVVACPKSERQMSGGQREGQREKLGDIQVWRQVTRNQDCRRKEQVKTSSAEFPKEQVGLIFIFTVLVCFAVTYS